MLNVICFGEVLFDCLPTGKIIGGAPLNVAIHLKNLGIDSQIISRIGQDDLGKELILFLLKKDFPTTLIQEDNSNPTGTVRVQLSQSGQPSYEIVSPVAWDFIEEDKAAREAVAQATVLVYGSLGSRKEKSKQTLLSLLQVAQKKIFDVNLRPPFYSKPLLETLLHHADIVKMNDEELEIIAPWYETKTTDFRHQMEVVRKQFNLEALLLTIGAKGACYLDDSGYYYQEGFPIQVKDTIGSGDSFLAAFISQYLQDQSPQKCLEFACATGALVATHSGGTPNINEEMVKAIMERT